MKYELFLNEKDKFKLFNLCIHYRLCLINQNLALPIQCIQIFLLRNIINIEKGGFDLIVI